MKNYLELIKNIGILTIGNFGTKLISFFLIPLYTSILNTADYGTYDIISTTINLLLPILTLEVSSGVLRYLLDEKYRERKKTILMVGLIYSAISCVIIVLFLLINYYFHIFKIFEEFGVFFFLLYILNLIFTLFNAYAKGIDDIKSMTIASVQASLSTILLNIIFLVFLKMGLKGYFIANILGLLFPCIYYIFKLNLFEDLSDYKVDKQLSITLVKYSGPLVFNSVGWWINNASDRYIVTWLCGIQTNGIYSIAYKIPNALSMLQNIFNQAWVLSSVKEFDAEDKNNFFANTYNIYNFFMVIVCAFMILFTKIFAKILFSGDFYQAWVFVPFLLISVVFGASNGLLGGIFSATKKSTYTSITTCVGATVNIILNIVLVIAFGAIGAAVSTMISYIVVWGMRLIFTSKLIKLNIRLIRDILAYAILIFESFILIFINSNMSYIINFLLIQVIILLYFDIIKKILKKVVKRYEKIK